MKTFQSKSLLESRTVGLLKGLTLLFLGASVAVLTTYGLTIDPGINNSAMYIRKIILTSDGTVSGTTGVVIDGNGNISADQLSIQNTINAPVNISYDSLSVDSDGNVGIGTGTPTAQLEVAGTMKHLSAMERKGSYTGNVVYFPQGVLSGEFNTGLDGDSLWYISCSSGSTGFFLGGFTGQNQSLNVGNTGYYFLLYGGASSTITYSLKAGETFFVSLKFLGTSQTQTCNQISVYKQNYGLQQVSGGGGVLPPDEWDQMSTPVPLTSQN